MCLEPHELGEAPNSIFLSPASSCSGYSVFGVYPDKDFSKRLCGRDMVQSKYMQSCVHAQKRHLAGHFIVQLAFLALALF